MLRELLKNIVRDLTYCTGCDGWYNPADPADWQRHKHCPTK
ncbi:hypothetical protein GCM10027570_31160 [Streptomonospora sediminis]